MDRRPSLVASLVLATVATLALPLSASGKPVLSISPTALSLKAFVGANVPSTTVRVWNSGTETLKWSVGAPSATWLTVSPTSGTNTGTLTLTFRTSALAAGLFNAAFSVRRAGGPPLR